MIADIEREGTQQQELCERRERARRELQQERARHAQRKAEEEAALLGTDAPATAHARPDGAAPEGKT